jgi:hypothetical protein
VEFRFKAVLLSFESLQPDSTKSQAENSPSTFNYGWNTVSSRLSKFEAWELSRIY